MLKTEYSLFLGKTSEQAFSGFITESGLFLVVEVEGASNETGNLFLTLIKEQVRTISFHSLAEFEALITQAMHKANLSLGASLAASYIHTQHEFAYLLTLGEGTIMLKRGKDVAEVIKGNATASGPVQQDDLYVLATTGFSTLFSSKDQFKKIVTKSDVFSVVDTIYEEIGETDDQGMTALFFSPLHAESELIIQQEAVVVEEGEKTTVISGERGSGLKLPKLPFLSKLSSSSEGPKRTLTLIAVVVIFGILIWSVVLSHQRRAETQVKEEIQKTKESVTSKLTQAEDAYTTNPSHSLELIAEAKKEVNDLKTAVGTKKPEEVAAVEKLVNDKENQLTNKEEKAAEEFYDLGLDTKNASAKTIYITDDTAVMLDKTKNTVYLLSLSKKSLDKITTPEIGSASLISYYENSVYLFIPERGIYTVSDTSKVKKIINADKDWGEIADLEVYSGNIYLLDTGKNDISKYLVTEKGYSDKLPYFKTNADVRSATSMVIDSAVYVGLTDKVEKFNGGLPTDFTTIYPGGSVTIQKVFTNDSLQKVFTWDKAAGTVYVLGKTGEYGQQIKSSIMKTATDFSASGDSLYFISGSKIYRVKI